MQRFTLRAQGTDKSYFELENMGEREIRVRIACEELALAEFRATCYTIHRIPRSRRGKVLGIIPSHCSELHYLFIVIPTVAVRPIACPMVQWDCGIFLERSLFVPFFLSSFFPCFPLACQDTLTYFTGCVFTTLPFCTSAIGLYILLRISSNLSRSWLRSTYPMEY